MVSQQSLAWSAGALDTKPKGELKLMLMQAHRRGQGAERDANMARMTDRWADKVLAAAELAHQMRAAPQVLWDHQRKWTVPRHRREQVHADSRSASSRGVTAAKRDGGGQIEARPLDLGCANDERLGNMRGMLELMARKKIQMLEMQSAADTEKNMLSSMKADVASLLQTHASLAGGQKLAAGSLAVNKRKLRTCEQQQRDTLNIMSCCRGVSQTKAIPEGWRWSHQRAACDACRSQLHKLMIQHSATELAARRVAEDERKLAVTKHALAHVGTAVKQVLDEAIYRPVTITTRRATEDRAQGIVFSIAAEEHPLVVTGIRCARHPWSQTSRQEITVLVSPYRTQEQGWKLAHDIATWTLVGQSSTMPASYTPCLPSVSVFDAEPVYGDVPLQHPFVIEPGTHRTVAIHTDDSQAILHRHQQHLLVGQRSDGNCDLTIKAGMALGADLCARLSKDAKSASFVGQVVYRRAPRL